MLASCSFHWRRRPRSEKPLLEHFGKVVSTMWNRVKNSRRSCSLALQPVVAIALLSELPDLRPGREERLHRTPDTNLSARRVIGAELQRIELWRGIRVCYF